MLSDFFIYNPLNFTQCPKDSVNRVFPKEFTGFTEFSDCIVLKLNGLMYSSLIHFEKETSMLPQCQQDTGRR